MTPQTVCGMGFGIELPFMTPCAQRCLRMAQVIAWHQQEPVDVDLLLLCLILDPEEATRARLVLRSVGGVFQHSRDAPTVVARAAGYVDQPGFEAPAGRNLVAAVRRLPYWMRRTGDEGIDTAHLLLACLEAVQSGTAGTSAFDVVRVTIHDVIRSAMAERHFAVAADRQRVGPAPILSPARPRRPAPYEFSRRAPDPPLLKLRNYQWRSWTAGAEHMNSYVVSQLVRLQVLLIAVLVFALIGIWIAAAYAFAEIDARSALALVPLLASVKRTPPIVRLAADSGLIALWMWWHLPGWLAVMVVAYHGLAHVESRVAVLLVRSDVADPGVSVADLRADLHSNVGTALIRRTDAWSR